MSVDPIGGAELKSPVQDLIRTAYRSTSGEQQKRSEKRPGEDPVSVSLQRASSMLQKMGSVNEEKNRMAKSIRETVKSLSDISGVAVKMKENLNTIVKNWPPFPQDSVERQELLMSYVSLRKEIEKLTFPPPPAPLYENNQKLWEKFDFADKEKMSVSLPDLSVDASDYQVQRAVMVLDDFQSSLGEARNELYQTVTE